MPDGRLSAQTAAANLSDVTDVVRDARAKLRQAILLDAALDLALLDFVTSHLDTQWCMIVEACDSNQTLPQSEWDQAAIVREFGRTLTRHLLEDGDAITSILAAHGKGPESLGRYCRVLNRFQQVLEARFGTVPRVGGDVA